MFLKVGQESCVDCEQPFGIFTHRVRCKVGHCQELRCQRCARRHAEELAADPRLRKYGAGSGGMSTLVPRLLTQLSGGADEKEMTVMVSNPMLALGQTISQGIEEAKKKKESVSDTEIKVRARAPP